MNNRERFRAVLNDQPYDHMPVVHFGYWTELLDKWAAEGHISEYQAKHWGDGNEVCMELTAKLGFDFGFHGSVGCENSLFPCFEPQVIADFGNGEKHVRNYLGVTELSIAGTGSIQAEIDHLLQDRASWEKEYLWRLQWHDDRVLKHSFCRLPDGTRIPLEGFQSAFDHYSGDHDCPLIMSTGSVLGTLRNIIGVVGLSYMEADDPELLREIVTTYNDLAYRGAKLQLEMGIVPDMIHYWEDICYNHGPLVNPAFFEEVAVPIYRRMSDLFAQYGVNLISIDCDGSIDLLLPYWLQGGVNTMFPIEIGTWHPDYPAWRRQYGKELRGVGGMNKLVLAQDRQAVDREIDRLKPWVATGGFIPCPDHRLPPETEWDLVRYYTDRMHETF